MVLAVILIGVTASDTWADYTISPRLEPQRGWALAMEEHVEEVRAAGGAVLVMPSGLGAEIEGVDAAGTRLIAGDTYRYVNLRESVPDAQGERTIRRSTTGMCWGCSLSRRSGCRIGAGRSISSGRMRKRSLMG